MFRRTWGEASVNSMESSAHIVSMTEAMGITGKWWSLSPSLQAWPLKHNVAWYRVDINLDCMPPAASDIYNLQESTGGLDSQGFGLSSQNSTDTAVNTLSNDIDSPEASSALVYNSQLKWGCQPFAGVGKRPLVSPGSSPVKQKPRVSLDLLALRLRYCHSGTLHVCTSSASSKGVCT